MPRYIIKLSDNNKDWYLEWSTIVDAPVTYGMSLVDFKAFYKEEYGNQGMEKLEERLKRVEKQGTSALYCSVDGLISYNRAGPKESSLSKQEIIDIYCTRIVSEII